MILVNIGRSFLNLLYPPLCLHCNHTLEHGCHIICRTCSMLLTLIDPSERCPYCFSSNFIGGDDPCCQRCIDHPLLLDGIAAAFDYEGPAGTLVKQLKYAKQTYLAEGTGAYLAAQWATLDWPMPEYIVPMPSTKMRRLERGFNQSLLLAQTLGTLIGSPVNDMLRRSSSDFSQAGLDHSQRLALSSTAFSVKEGTAIKDKCILIVDDVMTTGSSLRCCAEVLLPLAPKSIYALTVCRAM